MVVAPIVMATKQRHIRMAACDQGAILSAVRLIFVFILMAGLAPLAPAQVVVDSPAVEPYEGMWIPWIEPGSGLMIDQQDDTLVVTVFSYREDGTPIWYLASGEIRDGIFEEEASEFSGGSCLACPWQPAQAGDSKSIKLEFTGHLTGFMTWDGGAPRPIEALPFDSPRIVEFAPSDTHVAALMYDLSGRWVYVSKEGVETLYREAPYNGLGVSDPGGWDWVDEDTQSSLFCRDHRIFDEVDYPHCVYQVDLSESREILFSMFWGDLGPHRAVGYAGLPADGLEGNVRNEALIHGFRLTGPVMLGNQPPDLDEWIPPYVEKGMWIVPGEPGSGLMVDWQNRTLVFAIFTYAEDGTPIWYQGSGKFEGQTVNAEASRFSNGSCLSCEYTDTHEVIETVAIDFDFTSKTTAWLSIDGGNPISIRALPFDVPVFREFGVAGDFGMPFLYDLRGDWLFVSTEGRETFLKEVTFTRPAKARNEASLAWKNEAGEIMFRCDSKPAVFESPQCRLWERADGQWQRLFSAHWADVGEDQIIGYEEPPLVGTDGVTRGEKLIFGFRLSGPTQ